MFKIIRVQVVRLASLCAILFLVSSLPSSQRNRGAAANEAQNHRRPSTVPPPPPPTPTASSESSSAFVTNSDRAGATDTNGSSPPSPPALNGVPARSQRAGKILDFTTNEPRERHHLLTPRRLNSTLLMRLVIAPFQSRFSGADHEHSRARSSSGHRYDNSLNEPAKLEGKCAVQRRSRLFGDVLRVARDLLSSGISSIEQRAGGLLYLGSNLLATLIPLASLLGFGVGSHSSDSAAAGQSSGGANASATPTRGGVASLLAPPQKLVQIAASSGGIQSRVEYVMDLLERSIEHLPNFPRLHPQECVKRSICEAHNDPTKYGAIGLTLRLLFPASNSSTSATSEQDNMEFKVINKYRHAAGYGLARRLDSATNGTGSSWPNSGACREKYEDCLVSLLDVAQKLVDLFVA